jgi:hypothetical protein
MGSNWGQPAPPYQDGFAAPATTLHDHNTRARVASPAPGSMPVQGVNAAAAAAAVAVASASYSSASSCSSCSSSSSSFFSS